MLCPVLGITMSSLLITFGEPLLRIYISDSAEAIQYGMTRFACVSLPYFLLGLMDVSTGGLRGYGQSLGPMLVSVLGICGIRVLWVFTVFQIPAFHSLQWLYYSYPVSWIITLIAQMILFFRIRNQYLSKDVTDI